MPNDPPHPVPPSFRQDLWNIAFFALSRAIVVPAVGLLILFLVLGLVGEGVGAFAVIWKDPPTPYRPWALWDYAIFWNGFAITLFFLAMGYLVYLLFAHENPTALAHERRRRYVAAFALPPIALCNLPVLGLIENRWYFSAGTVLALYAFWRVVQRMTLEGKRVVNRVDRLEANRGWAAQRGDSLRRRLFKGIFRLHMKGKPLIERQADGLFGTVLATYCGLVGYTLCEYRTWSESGWDLWKWMPWAAFAGAAGFVWWRLRRWSLRLYALAHPEPTDEPPRERWYFVRASYLAAAAFWMLFGVAVGYAIALVIGVVSDLAVWALGTIFGQPLETRDSVRVLPAPLSFCFLLGAIATVYGLLRFYANRWFYPVMIAAIAGILTIASLRPYPHRLEELAPYYANTVNLADYDVLREDRAANEKQLDNEAVLEAWRKGVNEYRGKPTGNRPPLVIVTTAGGASVSAVYTFRMLVELENRIPGLHRHVRIITGASGGMFGASAYRAWLGTGGAPEGAPAWRDGLERDFFSPAVQSFAFKDIPMNLGCYRGYSNDRGRRLERSWEKELPKGWKIDFEQMRKEEKDGGLPSLIFSPMLVEDGRPLLISTLNLKKLSNGRYYVSTLPEKKAEDGKPSEPMPADPTPAVEFFKLFPGESGWSLRLGTAARLSASFPFLSPAATLPTVPPRRIVDAGYLDNYGMAVALGWLNDYILDIDPVTDRVIVLEIRPYGNTDDPKSILTNDERRARGKPSPFVWPLQEWTTPIEGGETARRAGMVSRNNLTRDLFVDLQDDTKTLNEEIIRLRKALRKGQIDTGLPFTIIPIRIKGNLASSLNWTLPKSELGDIHEAVDEVFLSEAELLAKHKLSDADKGGSEFYQRWKHNAFQFEELRHQFEGYAATRVRQTSLALLGGMGDRGVSSMAGRP